MTTDHAGAGLVPTGGQRADCPQCGKNLAVNQDGSLRKHQCEPLATEEPAPLTAEDVARVFDVPAELIRPRESQPDEQPTSTAAPRRQRRYCRVPNCGREPRPNGLCTSHRLHHGLIE